MFFTTTHRAFAAVAIISYMMSAEAFTQEPSIAQNPGSTSPIAPPTKAAPALDPSVEINRTWMWEKGTIFGDSNHSIAISGKTCNPGPNLGAYFIKEGTKLNSNVNSVPFTSNRSFNVAITSEPDGVHSLPQNGGLGEEICYVKIDFRSLRMESNLNQLELKGTCSYEILKYYQRNGKEKPHFKKKEDGVQVLLTAPWTAAPTMPGPSEADLAAEAELDSRRKECADMAAKDAKEMSEGVKLEQRAKLETTIQITVKGKTYDVEVYRWPDRSAGGSSVPPRIYIPDEGVPGFNQYQLPAQIANELATIVLDGLDGSLDDSLVDLDGKPIGMFEAEILSDKFSLELIRSIRAKKGSRNPLAEFNIKAPSNEPWDLVNGSRTLAEGDYNRIFNGLWLKYLDDMGEEIYRPAIEKMELAKGLADSGKVAEAYDLLKTIGDRYPCKLLDYADSLKAKASESSDPPAAK